MDNAQLNTAKLGELYGSVRLWQDRIPVGSEWKHYGGDVYEVTGHGINSAGKVQVEYRRAMLRQEPMVPVSFGAISPDIITLHYPADDWQTEVLLHRGQLMKPDVVRRMLPQQKLELANEHLAVPRFRRVQRVDSFVEIERV